MTNQLIAAVCLSGVLAFDSIADAQIEAPGTITIAWSKIAAGGGASSSTSFTATCTIGQPDAGAIMSGGTFTLAGGFWPGAHPACFGDINNNGAVNIDDLLAVIAAWGTCPGSCPPYCPSDVNQNCLVNIQDLLAVIAAWGNCP